jgi:transmembrane sensor
MIGALFRRKRPNTAAQWFAARLGGADSQIERRFHEWLKEDPAHAEEYALCEITWEVSHDAAKQSPEPSSRPGAYRAALGRRSAVFAAAAAAAAGLAFWYWPPTPVVYATAPGEQRTVALDDGSRLTLNTRTRISVRLERHAREVVLEEGEAFFEVAKDASRPFTVRTPLGLARAVGTRFDVYLDRSRLSVTTQEGRVLVETGRAGSGVIVDAGRQAELRSGMTHAAVDAANLNAALGWLTHRLEVNDAPLADVLEDFSRYTSVPLRADTARIAALRVSAVLRTGDLDALRATLRGAFGLDIERRGGELVVIDGKSRSPAAN